MDTIGFPTFLNIMNEQKEKRCIKRKGDMFIMICGAEGVGKSLLAIALGLFLDTTFNVDRIFYRWKEYQQLLKGALKNKLEHSNQAKVDEEFKAMGVNKAVLDGVKISITPGSVVHYDEAGSGMSNRQSQTRDVLEQYLAVQKMRHLRLVNIWCAPKLWVIDKYIRNERIKFFIWVDDMGTLDEPKRYAYIWSRSSMGRIYSDLNWWVTFMIGTPLVIKKYRPDYAIPIPNLEREWGNKRYIPEDLIERYEIRKAAYDLMADGESNGSIEVPSIDWKAVKKQLVENEGIAERTSNGWVKTTKRVLKSAAAIAG